MNNALDTYSYQRVLELEQVLMLAQRALRRWTVLYAHLQNDCGEVVSRKLDYNLPPAEHLKALEAIEDALGPKSVPPTIDGRRS